MLDKLFIVLQHLLPKTLLSRLAGKLAESRISWLKNLLIRSFVSYFKVDLSEAEYSDIQHYDTFNHFFTRRLVDGARTIIDDESAIVSPCDGVVSQFGEIEYQQLIQAKGKHYSLKQLLAGDDELCQLFSDGYFITCYLSPRDYHRVHMPVDGILHKSIYVPGSLFSVNQITAEHIDQLFARNERLICYFDTPVGPMASIMVGATIVAGIDTVWAGQVAPPPRRIQTQHHLRQPEKIQLKKGEEMGQFKLGSTVILLFAKDALDFVPSLQVGSELYMGEMIAQTRSLNNA